ncbi:MAG: MoaD/ThiS family protein [Actinomycetota bacterium]|nr:MoaD/ThiS family protein [Actinomycetota bacterium]
MDTAAEAGAARVTVRYWAAARAAAGREADIVTAATLADALAAVHEMRRDDARFDRVVGVCSVLVGDQPVGTRDPASVPLRAGDVIELLPPFAGG